jgi:hypothetical protein
MRSATCGQHGLLRRARAGLEDTAASDARRQQERTCGSCPGPPLPRRPQGRTCQPGSRLPRQQVPRLAGTYWQAAGRSESPVDRPARIAHPLRLGAGRHPERGRRGSLAFTRECSCSFGLVPADAAFQADPGRVAARLLRGLADDRPGRRSITQSSTVSSGGRGGGVFPLVAEGERFLEFGLAG